MKLITCFVSLVDEKERKNHNNPEEELQANEFQEYTRP